MPSKIFFFFLVATFSFWGASYETFSSSPSSSLPLQNALPSPPTSEAIEKVILNLLDKNPQIVLTALKKAMAQEEEKQLQDQEHLVQRHKEVLFKPDPTLPTAGNPQGDIQIVAFFDYQCGYCKKSEEALSEALQKDPNIHIIYREMPIFGKESIHFARLALAAHLQGHYTCFHKSLMNYDKGLTETDALKLAKKCNLDLTQLKKDMSSETVTKMLSQNKNLAENLKIDAAPFFIIGAKIIPGFLSKKSLQKAISEQRASSSLLKQK